MRNLLFEISYNGSRYHGWQVQQNAITVQQVVQDSIERLFQKRLDISGCSRTDTGVHANQYFFHMKTESKIPCNNIQRAMNTSLPDDPSVVRLSYPDFFNLSRMRSISSVSYTHLDVYKRQDLQCLPVQYGQEPASYPISIHWLSLLPVRE